MFWIAFAVMFVVALFLLKTASIFKNKETYQSTNQGNGLTYNNIAIKDLVNKDTDGDGILDWEEGLWGTDPTKKETTPGTPDSVAINKLKSQMGQDQQGLPLLKGTDNQGTEKLTQTEKFSRELFATIAAANQNGITMDQAAIDALSASLAEKIENPVVRKIFLPSDIKISEGDNTEAVRNYGDALNNIQKIYTVNYTVLDVLQEFMIDENNVNTSVLVKLGPIIVQTNKIIDVGIKTSVPKSLSTLHLNVINSLERLSENLNDIKLYDTDPILSLGAIKQYNQNATTLDSDMSNLQNAIQQKLNN